MVRQLTQQVVSHSPKASKLQRTHQRISPIPKSPLSSRSFHTKHTRLLAQSTKSPAGRFAKIKATQRPNLPTIQEEDEEDPEHFKPRSRASWSRRTHERDAHAELEDLFDEVAEDDEMDWDEETTLVALFQDDASDTSTAESLAALAEKLRGPMSAQSGQLKQYIADTLIPAVSQVKKVHEVLEDKVDISYGTGLLAFDEVCKRVETMALKTEDDLRSEHIRSQEETKRIMASLAEAYDYRDSLWTQLEEHLEQCGTSFSLEVCSYSQRIAHDALSVLPYATPPYYPATPKTPTGTFHPQHHALGTLSSPFRLKPRTP